MSHYTTSCHIAFQLLICHNMRLIYCSVSCLHAWMHCRAIQVYPGPLLTGGGLCNRGGGTSRLELMDIPSPLSSCMRQALAEHPNREFVSYLLNGLELGFCVCFRQGSPLFSATRNMHSASLHPSVMDGYLGTEAQGGRMLRPFPPPPPPERRASHQPYGCSSQRPHPWKATGRWRLITTRTAAASTAGFGVTHAL